MARAYIPQQFRTYCKNPIDYISKTPKNIEKLAFLITRYLINHELFDDTRIYFKTKNSWNAIQADRPRPDLQYDLITHKHYGKNYQIYLITDIDPNHYFEENGNYISIAFEGPLYHVLNGTEWLHPHDYVSKNLRNLFSHYGLFYELGDAWNLSLYEI